MSYFGLIDVRISVSENEQPVNNLQNCTEIQSNLTLDNFIIQFKNNCSAYSSWQFFISFFSHKKKPERIKRENLKHKIRALAGNKSDLGSRRTVEYEEANAYAEEKGLLFLETSAKNANNVNEIFLAIARKLPREDSGPKAQGISVTGEEGSSSGNKLGQCCNR
jgi:GTPase SAR1 family protein